jgi:hypothetical protein
MSGSRSDHPIELPSWPPLAIFGDDLRNLEDDLTFDFPMDDIMAQEGTPGSIPGSLEGNSFGYGGIAMQEDHNNGSFYFTELDQVPRDTLSHVRMVVNVCDYHPTPPPASI